MDINQGRSNSMNQRAFWKREIGQITYVGGKKQLTEPYVQKRQVVRVFIG